MQNNRRVNVLARSGQFGGMELRLIDEAEWLAASGWATKIRVTPFRDVQLFMHRAQGRGIGCKLLSLPLFMENWSLRHVLFLRALLFERWWRNELRCELAHVPFAWTAQGLSTLWLAGKVANQIVLSVHAVFPHTPLTAWRKSRLQYAFSKVSGVYGVSRAATRAFVDIFGELIPSRASVCSIPNFVDGERFFPCESRRQLTREKLALPEEALVVAAVGRLSEEKRPEMLVEVFAHATKEIANQRAYLLFIGGGHLESRVIKRARTFGVSDRLRLTGFVEDPELYLSGADLHVLASDREGFGIATVEAMASGVPTIATDTPGSREVLQGKHGGVLVPVDDMPQFVHVLRRLLADEKERCWRGRVARDEALSSFGRDVWSARLAAFYSEVSKCWMPL